MLVAMPGGAGGGAICMGCDNCRRWRSLPSTERSAQIEMPQAIAIGTQIGIEESIVQLDYRPNRTDCSIGQADLYFAHLKVTGICTSGCRLIFTGQ